MVFRLIIVLFFFSVGVFSQEKFIKHKISNGENLTVIAKKYGVKTKDIEDANPNAPKVLKLNSVLLIPNTNKKATTKKNEIVAKTTPAIISNSGLHEVQERESLWAISKKYNISVDDLKKANPSLESEGLKIGQKLNIPSNAIVSTEKTKKNPQTEKPELIASTDVEVKVKPKETKYLIAKKYGITVAELERQNPSIKKKLPVGYVLKIRTSKEKADQQIQDIAVGSETQIAENTVLTSENIIKNDEAKPEIIPAQNVDVVVEVQPRETKYAIAKKYGLTVAELERQNPSIKGKLPVGFLLKINALKEKADAAGSVITPDVNENSSTTTQVADNSDFKKDTTSVFHVSNHSELVNQLIDNATENIGTRYRSGGTTKAGFDCSGLMICTFNNFDIKLPRSSIEQSRVGTKVGTEEAQKGDLIFFKTNGRRHINHVGMVVEVVDGEIKFVHSSTHGGVIISSTKEPYYQRSFSQVNRVLQ
ncbi:LysM peptidoglycan-binding domain-containing protein [Flavobacterium sp. AC]|uniref:LysM peptidoglycan-binding domain-containing protein n=1 Tax=Flavobacterium azizsancarii TaxID=2961580 RepID=A0ABT4WIY6_9FLAO|nr:peptidoglycan endopeptidase [Flavobacterium azizsancarii]MDA6072010.1 LysM peptidoglycan-binding domain-containing protein [Flavobacterium azizsancarii]